MDTYLAVTSRRDEDRYAERPVPAEIVERILDAGRLSGSARNRQPWRFLVIEDPDLRARLAETVYEPGNVQTAGLVVAVTVAGKGPTSFDAGRAAQNMLLTAWNEGLISTPNGLADAERASALLGLEAEERPVIVLTFGWPVREREPERRSAAEWSARANRKPLPEIVARR